MHNSGLITCMYMYMYGNKSFISLWGIFIERKPFHKVVRISVWAVWAFHSHEHLFHVMSSDYFSCINKVLLISAKCEYEKAFSCPVNYCLHTCVIIIMILHYYSIIII